MISADLDESQANQRRFQAVTPSSGGVWFRRLVRVSFVGWFGFGQKSIASEKMRRKEDLDRGGSTVVPAEILDKVWVKFGLAKIEDV